MTLRLKSMMAEHHIKQADLAAAVDIGRPSLNALINHGPHRLPLRIDFDSLRTGITAYLQRLNVPDAGRWHEEEVELPRANAATPDPRENETERVLSTEEIETMIRHKQTLTPQARRHFGLTGDPFTAPTTADEVFLSPDIRYVRESMYQVARHGGFMAVVGESGAGKSVLREELLDRIARDEQSVIVIEPYVLAMESTDKVGKTLRSQHIAESIMACIAPLAKTRSSPEARFRQLHESLRDSSRAGQSHVVIIEEAHCLPAQTLKHLKRYIELKDGLRPLLSIILIAQPELLKKLSITEVEVREVVQRIEVLTLPSLSTNLTDYLTFRFKRLGMPLDKVFDRGALDALRIKLTPKNSDGTLLYPLAVHNALTAAMNRAADIGMPLVNADVIKGA